jgi:hypothetical protein
VALWEPEAGYVLDADLHLHDHADETADLKSV